MRTRPSDLPRAGGPGGAGMDEKKKPEASGEEPERLGQQGGSRPAPKHEAPRPSEGSAGPGAASALKLTTWRQRWAGTSR